MKEWQNPVETWSQEKIQAFRHDLLTWYDRTKRDLPWRQTKDPYRIWISEVMAQQTQVQTMLPYYLRFVEELPTVEALSQVDDEVLMSLWQGLGYYSRARNLKKAAQEVMTRFNGQLPSTIKELESLPGIGPYTAAAIGSIAFDLPEPAIDGNLFRVTARLFELDFDISRAGSRKYFYQILKLLIDPDRPGDFNQALMDLGATVMTPSTYYPEDHPLLAYDQSYQNQTSEFYPVKKGRTKVTDHHYLAYFIQREDGAWWMRQHGQGELLKDLWHFPLIELGGLQEGWTPQEVLEPLTDWLSQEVEDLPALAFNEAIFDPRWQEDLPQVRHIFSHRRWEVEIIPVKVQGNDPSQLSLGTGRWIQEEDLEDLAISTLQAKLFQALNE